jgi:hypothetical protein
MPEKHRKLCNGCGKSEWVGGVDQYVVYGDDPAGTEKFCVDCACTWLEFRNGSRPAKAAKGPPSIVERRCVLFCTLTDAFTP